MTTGLEFFLLRFFQRVRVLPEGSILSNHSSILVLAFTQKSEKSEKSNRFFPSAISKSSLPTTCPQFTTNSIPIHYINCHFKIPLLWRHFKTPLLSPFKYIIMDPLPRLYSVTLSFHFVGSLPKKHHFFISLDPFLLLSSFLHPLFIILLHIFTNLSSFLLAPAFPFTASSKVHIYSHFNYSNASIHSKSYSLFTIQ